MPKSKEHKKHVQHKTVIDTLGLSRPVSWKKLKFPYVFFSMGKRQVDDDLLCVYHDVKKNKKQSSQFQIERSSDLTFLLKTKQTYRLSSRRL